MLTESYLNSLSESPDWLWRNFNISKKNKISTSVLFAPAQKEYQLSTEKPLM